jgi:CspA family cold shock protein
MAKGIVKWFNRQKGFGFIESEETGQEVFLYFPSQAGRESLAFVEGDRVEFDAQETPRGLHATQVRKLDLTAVPE